MKDLMKSAAARAILVVSVFLFSTGSCLAADDVDAIPKNASKSEDGLAKVPTTADIDTVRAANKIPGVEVQPNLMAQPVLDEPIKGFHPIKKIMRPVENLAKQSVILGQQVMRLEAPIASLQPSMLGLEKRMTGVQQEMTEMQAKIGGMQQQVVGARGNIKDINLNMGNVRGDLSGMRTKIVELQRPIKQLRDPIVQLQRPLEMVAQPVSDVHRQLASVDKQLSELKTLLGTVLFSIYVAAAAIAFGTPIAAFIVYKNRRKLFPNVHEADFPVAANSR